MKTKLTVTKDQIKQTLLEEPIFSPDDTVFEFVNAEFSKPTSTNETILTNILNKFDDADLIKGILLYGIINGMNMYDEEEDDFATDICTCGCTTTH